jgi:hypothetical protein
MFSRELLVALQHNFYIPFVQKCRPLWNVSPTEKLNRQMFLVHYRTVCRAVESKQNSKLDLLQSVCFFEKFVVKGSLKTPALARNVFKPKTCKVFDDYGTANSMSSKLKTDAPTSVDVMDGLSDLFSVFPTRVRSQETSSMSSKLKTDAPTSVDVMDGLSDLFSVCPTKIVSKQPEDIIKLERNADIKLSNATNHKFDTFVDRLSACPSKIVCNLETKGFAPTKREKYNVIGTLINVDRSVGSIVSNDSMNDKRNSKSKNIKEPRYYTRYQAGLVIQPHRRHSIFSIM